MLCGATLDGVYTCTRALSGGEHIGQHYDTVNDVQWRDELGIWLLTLGSHHPDPAH